MKIHVIVAEWIMHCLVITGYLQNHLEVFDVRHTGKCGRLSHPSWLLGAL